MPLQAEYSRLSHRSEEEVNESFPYLRKSQDWSIFSYALKRAYTFHNNDNNNKDTDNDNNKDNDGNDNNKNKDNDNSNKLLPTTTTIATTTLARTTTSAMSTAITKTSTTYDAGEEGSRRREARKRGTLGSNKVLFLK